MVNGVASWEKLANGGAPFNMSTELANGVAPLANGENGGRRGTAPVWEAPCATHTAESYVKSCLLCRCPRPFPANAVELGIDDHWCTSIRKQRHCWIALLLGDTA
jgi:hypothetical protein